MSRRVWWLGALTAVAATAAPAAAAWGEPQLVPGSRFQNVERLTLRADGGLDVHLAIPALLTRRSANGTWTAVPESSTPNTSWARAINGSGGRAALVGGRSPRADYRVGAVEHSLPLDIATASSPFVPAARLSDSGHGLLAWVDGSGAVSAIFHAAGGIQWEAPLIVVGPQPDRPRAGLNMALAENGAAVVVWTEQAGATTAIRAIHRAGPGVPWSVPQTVVATSARVGEQQYDDQARVLVGMDGAGNATIAWVEAPERTRRVLRSSSLGQATGVWTPVVEVASAVTVAEQPIASLDVAEDGNAIVGWWAGTTRAFDVWVARRLPGGPWGSPRLVSQGVPFERVRGSQGTLPEDNNRRPRVAIATGGMAVVVWARAPGSGLAPVPQASFGTPDGAWSAPQDLSNPKRENHLTVDDGGVAVRIGDGVDVDATGRAAVAWASYFGAGGVLVAETSPPGRARVRRPVRLLEVTTPRRPRRAGPVVPLELRLNRAVEQMPVLVERLAGRRWMWVAQVMVSGFDPGDGSGPEVQVRAPSPGTHRYRVRLLGAGADRRPRSVVVRAVPAVPRTVRTCKQPVAERGAPDGSIWLLCQSSRSFSIQRARPAQRTVSRPVGVGPGAVDLAVSAGTVWVLRQRSLVPVAVGGSVPGAPLDLSLEPDEEAIAVAAGGRSVWILTLRVGAPQRLLRLDPVQPGAIRAIELSTRAMDLLPRARGVFLVVPGHSGGDPDFRVAALGVDEAGNVANRSSAGNLGDLDSGPAGVWGAGTFVIDADFGSVLTRVEPRTKVFPNALKRPPGHGSAQIAVGDGVVWGLTRSDGAPLLMRVDPVAGRVVRRTFLPRFEGPLTVLFWDASPHLVAAGRRAWIVDREHAVVVPAG